ncbi:MAG: hypothetical protein ACOX7D_01175 [Alphaproteobacteria bacterium]|jgi:hypothetical protein
MAEKDKKRIEKAKQELEQLKKRKAGKAQFSDLEKERQKQDERYSQYINRFGHPRGNYGL